MIDDFNKFPFIELIETHTDTGNINQVTLRKHRKSSNKKYAQQVKIKGTQNQKQMEKYPILQKTCDGKYKNNVLC